MIYMSIKVFASHQTKNRHIACPNTLVGGAKMRTPTAIGGRGEFAQTDDAFDFISN